MNLSGIYRIIEFYKQIINIISHLLQQQHNTTQNHHRQLKNQIHLAKTAASATPATTTTTTIPDKEFIENSLYQITEVVVGLDFIEAIPLLEMLKSEDTIENLWIKS